jgi:ParB-like nuclease domain
MRKKIPGLISIDKNYIPALATDGDELYPNGIFVFNITKMIEYIQSRQGEIRAERIEVKEYRDGLSTLDESYIDKADITVPIIIAEIRPGGYNVIDGNHRLEKAYRIGMEYISAYVLKPEQHMPFLTSLKAYHTYIEYWNSKITQNDYAIE